MKTILKLIPVFLLALLAASCAKTVATPPPTTTVPPIVTPSQPTATIPPTTPPSTTTSPTPSTVTFDFDTGMPALRGGQSTPLAQTSGGVMAYFSSPADPSTFSVQNHDTTFLTLSQFSGNYLYQNNPFRTYLNIRFSQPLTSITLIFATTDSHGPGEVEEPTTIKLTAYMNSTGTTPVGSATVNGSFSGDSYPQGTLSFASGDNPFNLVVIELLYQARGGTAFFVDNIAVMPSGQGYAGP